MTPNAFIITTKSNIATAIWLQGDHDFQYVLSAAWSSSPFEKCLGKSKQRIEGNFHIDICNRITCAKVVKLYQLK